MTTRKTSEDSNASSNNDDEPHPAELETDVRVLDLQHALDQAHEEISMLVGIDEPASGADSLKKKTNNARLIDDLNDQPCILRATVDQMTDTLRTSEKTERHATNRLTAAIINATEPPSDP